MDSNNNGVSPLFLLKSSLLSQGIETFLRCVVTNTFAVHHVFSTFDLRQYRMCPLEAADLWTRSQIVTSTNSERPRVSNFSKDSSRQTPKSSSKLHRGHLFLLFGENSGTAALG